MKQVSRGAETNGHQVTYSLVMDSPLGRLGICLQDEAVCRIDYLPPGTPCQHSDSAAARRAVDELQHYFADTRHLFDLPVVMQGTPFQQRVWQALRDIPAGETRSYGQLAAQLGSGARAVGNACRHNPVSIVVPCHRVVGASGLGGYSGHTQGPVLRRKSWLLAHEGVLPGDLKNDRSAPINRKHSEFARSSHA
ncbi:MAG: methylated-DNA--[protein]-cysteine S-methyltransferase [Gammaproteobacteria bacterium]|nr:methylated-DNA--[protein]-cysteine S-methyltransferase [Gammaproteobacteria bacterium]